MKYYNKRCKCGCGRRIIIKPWHKYSGIPDYFCGHYNKGKKYSIERRNNISRGLTGRKLSKEHIRNMSIALTGRKLSMETKNKIRNTMLKLEFVNVGFGGHHHFEDTKRIISRKNKISMKGDKNPSKRQNVKDKISLAHKKRFKENPSLIDDIRRNRLNQVIPKKDSSIEIKLQKELCKRNIDFETHKSILGQPDIFIEPNIVVFADGDYWHDFPSGTSRDFYVTDKLIDDGYVVFRFWEHEIKDCVSWCVNRIERYIHNRRISEITS